MTEARCKRLFIVWFHSSEMSRKDKFIETEIREVISWDWRWEQESTALKHRASYGVTKCSKMGFWGWLHDSINLLKIIGLDQGSSGVGWEEIRCYFVGAINVCWHIGHEMGEKEEPKIDLCANPCSTYPVADPGPSLLQILTPLILIKILCVKT